MKRSQQAFRPGTKQNHLTMFNSYLNFCQKYKIHPINPSVQDILAYLEFLSMKFKSPKSVQNYWSAVKFLHVLNDSPFQNAKHIQVDLMLRAIPLTKRHISNQKLPINKQHILKMCKILDLQGTQGLVIKSAVLIGFYGFLRASNLCPTDARAFDHTRHFTREDVIVTKAGLKLRLKWAKNLQSSIQPHIIPIPAVTPAQVDPLTTFIRMCTAVPAHHKKPLFMLNQHLPLTVSKLRSVFALLCEQIGINPQEYSLHSLRRGGATQAYSQGAQLLDIQRHGAWSSTAFYDYVAPQHSHQSTVCSALSF